MNNYPCYIFDLGWQIKYYEDELSKANVSFKRGKGLNRVDYFHGLQSAYVTCLEVIRVEELKRELKGLGFDLEELGVSWAPYNKLLELKENVYRRLENDKSFHKILEELITGRYEERKE